MTDNITPEGRTATIDNDFTGSVTLINKFRVPEGRDDKFLEMWTEASMYFRRQPGYVSLRLHRAVSTDAEYRWINVAVWETEAEYRTAHSTDEFRRVVTAPGWEEFPSTPALYEVVVADNART
jgi:heme-degrading monooxygenase HmoA